MSHINNEILLEALYEKYLKMGYNEKEAEEKTKEEIEKKYL